MKRKLRKSYSFALKSALLITGVFSVVLFFLSLQRKISLFEIMVADTLLFFISFFILQYRVEHFIYRRVQKIFKEVSLLETASIDDRTITTDMVSLNQEIMRFAKDKKMEIESLKIREDYRKEYIGNISHELNTPLFMIQGYIHTLLDGAMYNKVLLKKYLQRAAKGADRLTFIVKDLELISKLEAGELHLEMQRFDIVETIHTTFELLEMRASRKHISLEITEPYPPTFVFADKERIQQVLMNLLVNSIKYGKRQGVTEVSIESISENKILVRVSDNGEGVAPENINRIFERFYRVDKSGNRRDGGSGLGLSIVKHIIEAHKEKVYANSFLGIGSEFSFTLSTDKPHA